MCSRLYIKYKCDNSKKGKFQIKKKNLHTKKHKCHSDLNFKSIISHQASNLYKNLF